MKQIIILLLVSSVVQAQKEFDGLRGTHKWIGFSDAPNSLYHHIAGEAYAYLDKRPTGFKTLQAWQQRQQWIRKTLQKVVGPFPEKTPLHATITKTINKDNYTIENITYESLPGFVVTASLFIPRTKKKAPAIIYCSGHSNTGYRSYQNMLVNLVNKGFVVFAFDPIGQGERLQYYNAATGKSDFKWPAFEHSYAGAQVFLTGNTIARYFIWDGIRAIDYLLTRKEVDANRIGITGRSGGGTQSAYIAAFDDRIKAVAPENYFTNYTRLFQSMGPQDAEQDFMYGIEQGLDMADLLLVRAPKPALMITTTQDMFPIQGAIETAQEVGQVYNLFDQPNAFRMVSDDAPHASTKKNRESMYAFFQRYLDNPGDSTDSQYKPLTPEELQVTKTGQVQGETVYSLNYKEAMKKLGAARSNILQSAKELSGYRAPTTAADPLFAGRIQRDCYVIEKYLVKGEGSYMIPYTLWKPGTPTQKSMIYLDPAGKAHDTTSMEWFVKHGITVLAPDLPGIGELGPGDFKGDSYIDSVSYNLWFAAMLVKRSIVGIQAGDVVSLTSLLKKNYNEIYGLAKKQMAPVLLHAAAFDNNISKIALIEPYSSYRSIVMSPRYKPEFLHSTVAGAIGIYDLPDLAAGLAPKPLLLAGVTDGDGGTDIDQDLSIIKTAYHNKAQIIPIEHLTSQLTIWLEK
jgi:hypothetical protein